MPQLKPQSDPRLNPHPAGAPETPAPAPPEGRRPDAIMFAPGWDPGFKTGNRFHEVLDHCERVLGGKAHVSHVGDQALVSTVPHPTYLYPEGHKHAKFPRYDWYPQPDGSRHGYLKPEDRAAATARGETPEAKAAREEEIAGLKAAYRKKYEGLARFFALHHKPEAERSKEEREEYARLAEELKDQEEAKAPLAAGAAR